ncbi:MAG: hypothetical protein Q9219_001870 [cf. Caloplaca sp. 3 TL-2023]
MAANREERFLMRQRGAGTRDIILSFDLELPGVPQPSRTPLTTRKSGRFTKLPPGDPAPPKSTRKTPKAKASISTSLPAKAAKTPVQSAKRTPSNGETITTRKRMAMEDISEVQSNTLPRKRRKRKSIEQRPSKKAQPSQISKKPIALVHESTGARKPRNLGARLRKATRDQQEHEPEENPPLADTPEDEDNKNNLQTALKRQSRKTKSSVQARKPKKKPPTIQQQPLEITIGEVDNSQEPVRDRENLVEPSSIEESIKNKPRKRKRKAIAQSPRKRRKPLSSKQPQLPLLESEEKSEALAEELQSAPMADAVDTRVKLTKRGRRPKSVVEDSTTPQEAVIPTASESTKPINVQNKSPPPKVPPQSEQEPQTPRRKIKKRKMIGQVRRPKKKLDVNNTTTEANYTASIPPETTAIVHTENVKPAPETKRRCRSKKSPVSHIIVQDDHDGSKHDIQAPIEAPKKRGRPKKATTIITTKPSVEKNGSTSEDKNSSKLTLERVPKKSEESAPLIEPQLLPRKPNDEPPKEVSEPPAPPIVKKRGRPKKQIAATSKVKEVANSPKGRPSKAKVQRPIIQTKPSSTKIEQASTQPLIEKPNYPTTLQICDDEYDDPLSDFAPILSKPKSKPLRTSIASFPKLKQPRGKPNPQPTAEPVKKKAPVLMNPRSPALKTQTTEPSPQPQTPPPDTTTAAAAAALDTHILSSRQEEAAFRHDLRALQAQQAHELAEQKERDRAARLEVLSLNQRRQEETKKRAPEETEVNVKTKERMISLGKGKDLFVFRSVKRRKVEDEDKEEIDPELQALLSKVKGVGVV